MTNRNRPLSLVRRIVAVAGASILFIFAPLAQAQISPASGYWWNTAQAGNGFVIEVQGTSMFMAGFLYDVSGRATWVASFGPMASSTSYSGTLVTFSGGQTLTGAFKSATQSPTSAGNISINFTSNTQATLTWPGGTIPIQRLDFGPGGSAAQQNPANPQTGWWYNTSEGGRGFGVEVQGNSMYLAGYMYDASGNPVWYLASGNMTNTGVFQGQWVQYQGGLTLTGPYKPPTLANGNVGSVTMQFSSTSSATLTLPDLRQVALTRYAFGVSGPTLSAFSPASAAPTSLLSVTGSNINPAAALSFTFSDSTGFSVNVPLAAATATNLSVSVPPYYNVATGAFGSGSVNLKLTQSSGGVAVDSNTLSGFTIQKLPPVPGTPGQSTISLIRANLAAAQKLQTTIKNTAQDTPAIEASLTTQIADLQSLVTNIQSVVTNGLSYSLGAVGGVNITVTPSNIGDVDSLILATLQSLSAPPSGGLEKSAEATTPGCMSAEATAYANAILNGTTGAALDALALALVQAPNTSAACNTVASFTSAYQIFGGAGNIGLGITNQAGSSTVTSKLPGAALFSTASANANIAVGLNALLSAALASQASAVQTAISNVTTLAAPATNALIAKAVGTIATNLTDTQVFINTVAPPSGSGGVPTNLPTGNYSLSYTYTISITGYPQTNGGDGPIPLSNVDANAFATQIESIINSFNSSYCGPAGVSCNASYTPFNGTTFQVMWTISGPGVSVSVTYVLTKI